jgi:hypothetical protein
MPSRRAAAPPRRRAAAPPPQSCASGRSSPEATSPGPSRTGSYIHHRSSSRGSLSPLSSPADPAGFAPPPLRSFPAPGGGAAIAAGRFAMGDGGDSFAEAAGPRPPSRRGLCAGRGIGGSEIALSAGPQVPAAAPVAWAGGPFKVLSAERGRVG